MDRLPNWLKWLVVALVFAVLAVMVLAVDRRASRVDMPDPETPSASTVARTAPPPDQTLHTAKVPRPWTGAFAFRLSPLRLASLSSLPGWGILCKLLITAQKRRKNRAYTRKQQCSII